MGDPIQESDLAKRNAAERELIIGARDNPQETKMPDGRTVAEYQAETYEQHLAEARADEAIQQQRIREQSVSTDPLYAQPVTAPPTSINLPQPVVITETVSRRQPAQREAQINENGQSED